MRALGFLLLFAGALALIVATAEDAARDEAPNDETRDCDGGAR